MMNGHGNESQDAIWGDGCGCFRMPCFGRRRGAAADGQSSRGMLLQEGGEGWLEKQAKKLREVSELVAGPKWKNFVRRIGRYFTCRKSPTAAGQFQYTPQNYALNFDDGEEDDDTGLLLASQSRFPGEPPRRAGSGS